MSASAVFAGRWVGTVVHRSPAGPDRELFVAGVHVCRRCFALKTGLIAGLSVGMIWTASTHPWVVLLGLPAAVDAVAEKHFGGPLRRGFLTASNAVLGAVIGLYASWVFRTFGTAAILLVSLCGFVLSRCLRVARHRSTRSFSYLRGPQ